jgi:hypothetical protein
VTIHIVAIPPTLPAPARRAAAAAALACELDAALVVDDSTLVGIVTAGLGAHSPKVRGRRRIGDKCRRAAGQ